MKKKHYTPDIQILKGKFRLPPPIPKIYKKPKKVVVFDLDETLGSFSDLFILWSGIQHICPKFDAFNALLDTYPEFLRYGILAILQYIYQQKQNGECYKIFIYTNNQCSKAWVHRISEYFKYKLSIPQNKLLFDQNICAFKIGNQPIELSRTTHQKTHNDFISCTLIPRTAEVCFVDDMEYSQMKQDKIYYIRPRPYIHGLTIREILDRFLKNIPFGYSCENNEDLLKSSGYWENWFLLNGRKDGGVSPRNLYVDIEVSKKIMFSIKEFFLLTTYYESKMKQKAKYTRKKSDVAGFAKTRRQICF